MSYSEKNFMQKTCKFANTYLCRRTELLMNIPPSVLELPYMEDFM